LSKFDGTTFTNYTHDLDDPNSLNAPVNKIQEDDRGVLWLGTYTGLDKFDPANETFTHYQHRQANPTSLSNDVVTFLGTDKQGGFWVGTLGGGLNKFDPQTGRFITFQYDKADPLRPCRVAIQINPCLLCKTL
jgi:ligand-binding sensor domain-containing protein